MTFLVKSPLTDQAEEQAIRLITLLGCFWPLVSVC